MASKKALHDGTAGGINPITGDRLTTGYASDEYRKNYPFGKTRLEKMLEEEQRREQQEE